MYAAWTVSLWSIYIYVCVIFRLHLLFILSPTVPYTYLPQRKPHNNAYNRYNKIRIANIKDIPHHVLIVYGLKYCSGSLTGSRTVVTAASCLRKNNGETIVVKVGSSSMIGSGQIIFVLEYKVHEYFEYLSTLDNDIALLMLQEHVQFGDDVIKAQLVEPEIALRDGTPIKVSGWGGTDLPIKYLNLLLESEMVVINKTECQKKHGNLITPSNFCVKYTDNHRLSDNGGGAIFEDILVGVLSWGASGTEKYNIAILTNISFFERWITLNTKKFLTKYCSVKENVMNIGLQSDEDVDN